MENNSKELTKEEQLEKFCKIISSIVIKQILKEEGLDSTS